jgi:hypothetical protein
VLTVAITAAMAAIPAVAAQSKSDSGDGARLTIGQALVFDTAAGGASNGTFTAVGAVDDSGSASSKAKRTGDQLSGTEVLTGSKGTIHLTFGGTIEPKDGARQVVRGTFNIVSGSGAYTALRGQGSFVIVADHVTQKVTRIDQGAAYGVSSDE